MDWTPLSTLVDIESKRYSVETTADSRGLRFTCCTRLGGRTLSKKVLELPEGTDQDTALQKYRDFHRGRAVELEAIFRLGRKIDEKPTVDAYTKLGVILLANGFHDDACARFQRAIETDPGHLAALKNFGIALSLLGDHAGSVAAFHRAKEMGPGFADLYYHLGNAHLDRMELDEATQSYLQALQINPRYADARLKLAAACVGYLLRGKGDLPDFKIRELEERAISESDTASQLNPKIRNRILLMAQDSLKLKRYDEAYKQYLEVRPRYAPRVGDEVVFFFTLTLLYGSEGIDLAMTENYIEKLGEVIEEYPHYADLHQHLGAAFLIKSRFVVARALREFKRTVEINPQMSRAQETMAETEEVHRRVLAVLKKALISN